MPQLASGSHIACSWRAGAYHEAAMEGRRLWWSGWHVFAADRGVCRVQTVAARVIHGISPCPRFFGTE
jgi:hypothetical protein